jgi:hypothetical protein
MRELTSGCCAVLGILGLIAAPFLVLLMLLWWLKSGEWPDWSLTAFGWWPPTTEYLGFNKILRWLYARELAVLCFGAGLLLVWLGLWVAETPPPEPQTS